MAVGDRNDPYRSYNFLVEIDGITGPDFKSVRAWIPAKIPLNIAKAIKV